MSIRISEGGRLFGIMAGLGGAAMSGSAGRSWAKAVFVSSDYLRYDVRELNGADRLAMLVLGIFVIAGASSCGAARRDDQVNPVLVRPWRRRRRPGRGR
jgi:hypothetical protein